MYRLYNTGNRTEPGGTPAAIFLGEESSPSTEALNFLLHLVFFIKYYKVIKSMWMIWEHAAHIRERRYDDNILNLKLNGKYQLSGTGTNDSNLQY
jgi:hypothetical protein